MRNATPLFLCQQLLKKLVKGLLEAPYPSILTARHHTPRLGTSQLLTTSVVDLTSGPPYSPDVAPCDFFLLPSVNNQMRWRIFNTPEEEIETYDNSVSEVRLEQ